jgi:hypothetical protein
MLDREMLEKEALAEVCACWYYDLADHALMRRQTMICCPSLITRTNAISAINSNTCYNRANVQKDCQYADSRYRRRAKAR